MSPFERADVDIPRSGQGTLPAVSLAFECQHSVHTFLVFLCGHLVQVCVTTQHGVLLPTRPLLVGYQDLILRMKCFFGDSGGLPAASIKIGSRVIRVILRRCCLLSGWRSGMVQRSWLAASSSSAFHAHREPFLGPRSVSHSLIHNSSTSWYPFGSATNHGIQDTSNPGTRAELVGNYSGQGCNVAHTKMPHRTYASVGR